MQSLEIGGPELSFYEVISAEVAVSVDGEICVMRVRLSTDERKWAGSVDHAAVCFEETKTADAGYNACQKAQLV